MGQSFFSQNGWGFAIILIVKLLPLLRFSENLNNNHSIRLTDGWLGDNFCLFCNYGCTKQYWTIFWHCIAAYVTRMTSKSVIISMIFDRTKWILMSRRIVGQALPTMQCIFRKAIKHSAVQCNCSIRIWLSNRDTNSIKQERHTVPWPRANNEFLKISRKNNDVRRKENIPIRKKKIFQLAKRKHSN